MQALIRTSYSVGATHLPKPPVRGRVLTQTLSPCLLLQSGGRSLCCGNNLIEQQGVTTARAPCLPQISQGLRSPSFREEGGTQPEGSSNVKGQEQRRGYQPTSPLKSAQKCATHSLLANTSCLSYSTSREQRGQPHRVAGDPQEMALSASPGYHHLPG